jgi:glutaredoxin
MEKRYIIITKQNCPWCVKAKDLLLAMDIPFNTIDISRSDEAKAILKLFNIQTVPQVINNDGAWIGDYEALVTYLNMPEVPQNTPF